MTARRGVWAAGGGRHFGQDPVPAQLQPQVQAAQRRRVERERDHVGGLTVGAAAPPRLLFDLQTRPQLGREVRRDRRGGGNGLLGRRRRGIGGRGGGGGLLRRGGAKRVRRLYG